MQYANLKPPRISTQIFKLFCDTDIYEELQGDLQESYIRNVRKKGKNYAGWKYIIDVFAMIRPSVGRKFNFFKFQNNQNEMLRNYTKITIRNLMRSRLFSAINILGLAISMSVGLLVITIMYDQFRYDHFHANKDRIYRVISHSKYMHYNPDTQATTAMPLGAKLKEEYPGIEEVVRIGRNFWGDVDTGERKLPLNGHFADANFLKVFSFPLLHGNPDSALKDPFSIVLTQKASKKLFGDKNSIGQIVSMRYGDFEVTGVLKDLPRRSHMQFEILGSFATLETLEKEGKSRFPMLDQWTTTTGGYIYLLLPEDHDLLSLKSYLSKVSKDIYHKYENRDVAFDLQALLDISPGWDMVNQIAPVFSMELIIVFWVLTGIIMFSAISNYTTLSLARALKRAKEIGIRKVVGGKRIQIFTQFIVEAVIIALFALGLAIAMFYFLRNEFYKISSTEFNNLVELNLDIVILLYFILFAIAIGFLAGLFPAMYFSKIEPAIILKDNRGLKLFKRINMRKAIIVIQFTLSLIFIISVTILNNLYRYSINFDFGFQTENILNIPLQGNDYQIFENEFSSLPEVSQISFSAFIMSTGTQNSTWAKLDNQIDSIHVHNLAVSSKYLKNHELKLIAGPGFPEIPRENEILVVVNQTLLEAFDINNPEEIIDKTLDPYNGNEMRIVGVVEDFNHGKVSQPISPFFFKLNPKQFRYANLQVNSTDVLGTMEKMEKSWKNIDGNVHIFKAEFYEDKIKDSYSSLTVVMKILGSAAFLAISIACLGLLGMAVFTAETKIKEVGIRKVMGASELSIVIKLSSGFIQLLGIASIIAVSLTYYFFKEFFLSNFANKTSLGIMDFGFGVILMFVIGGLIIGSQTWIAARTRPSLTLKDE